jgi:hypothetical protein
MISTKLNCEDLFWYLHVLMGHLLAMHRWSRKYYMACLNERGTGDPVGHLDRLVNEAAREENKTWSTGLFTGHKRGDLICITARWPTLSARLLAFICPNITGFSMPSSFNFHCLSSHWIGLKAGEKARSR